MARVTNAIPRLVMLAAVVMGLSCEIMSSEPDASVSPRTLPSAPTSASADSRHLANPADQRTIEQALARGGVRVTRMIPSKFDWLFGDAAPRSGTFETSSDGTQSWADVHFLEMSLESLTACSRQGASGETEFAVSVEGRTQVPGSGRATGALAGSGPMYFVASDRFFVMTPDIRVRDTLRSSLSLSVPPC